MANYAVVRTDLMYGTDVRSGLVSIRYMGEDGATPTAIENGNVLKVGDLMDGEREIHVGEVPTEDTAVADIVLIDSVEIMYDDLLKNLDQFINLPGAICRGYRLHSGDVFSVTAEALEGEPAVGSEVAIGAGTKLVVGGSGTVVGKIIEAAPAGRYMFYAIKVD